MNFAKPAKSPPRAVLDGGFATVTAVFATVTTFCFFFLFISSESLKNHNK
jgi:hypothetical protein